LVVARDRRATILGATAVIATLSGPWHADRLMLPAPGTTPAPRRAAASPGGSVSGPETLRTGRKNDHFCRLSGSISRKSLECAAMMHDLNVNDPLAAFR
jgi:hypothetical protein